MSIPFMVMVHFDADEVTTIGATKMSEQFDPPAGITGFHINYMQIDC